MTMYALAWPAELWPNKRLGHTGPQRLTTLGQSHLLTGNGGNPQAARCVNNYAAVSAAIQSLF